MTSGSVRSLAAIEWGVACFKPANESECGDLHLVRLEEPGALVAVVDGVGHGSAAASVSRLAVATLEKHTGEGMIGLVRRCHEQLKGTRGVVMTLASFACETNEMTWLAVGNVESFLYRHGGGAIPTQEEVVILRGGLVGCRLPALQAAVLPVGRGDLLILATDGIRRDFFKSVHMDDPPQRIADRICRQYAKQDDDGLVLVVRYLGRDT
jgi:phosphoserine phosphatase RsbX